jgi:hypothetical protein
MSFQEWAARQNLIASPDRISFVIRSTAMSCAEDARKAGFDVEVKNDTENESWDVVLVKVPE